MGFKQVMQNRQLASIKPFVKMVKWNPRESSPRSVGLILYLEDMSELVLLKKVQTFFTKEGAECRTCIFKKNPKQHISEEWVDKSVVLIDQKSVNWYGMIRPGYIESFVHESFDLVINLSKNYFFTTAYVASLAKASLKVGRYVWPLTSYHLVLGTGQSHNEDDFIHLLDSSLQFIRLE